MVDFLGSVSRIESPDGLPPVNSAVCTAEAIQRDIQLPKDEGVKEALPRDCLRCTEPSARDAKFCGNFGLPLDVETGPAIDRVRENLMEALM